jgi:flagellin
MPLGVNQNLAATGVLIQLKNNESIYQQQIERLSSGMRINRAADDPAGLVISEKYKAQVDGLDQAVRNANDGVSLTQTAEGALDEISNQLRGMRNLALHAANTGPNDQSAIQADQDQIASAIETINRIASTTQFGTRKLLDGSSGVSGVSTSTNVTFLSGSDKTVGGTYAVNVTQAAVQGSVRSAAAETVANVTGASVDSTTATAATGTLTFSGALVGASNVTVDVGVGETMDDIKNDINNNTALNEAGIKASMVDDGGGNAHLEITSSKLSGAGAGELKVQASTADLKGASGIDNAAAVNSATANATSTNLLRNDETLSFRNSAGTSVQVALKAGQSIATAVSQLNQALQGAGVKITASFDGTSHEFQFQNNEYGSASTVGNTIQSSLDGHSDGANINLNVASTAGVQYNIASATGLTNKTDGADIAGTIGGLAASGSGQVLTGASGTAVEGLALKLAGGVSGAQGNVTVNQGAMTFQIGAFANQTVGLAIGDMRAAQLGTAATGVSSTTSSVSVAGIDVTKGSGSGAQDALNILDSALTQVNTLRASLGSFQKDTLQSSVRNMMVAEQNMRTSQSQISDANMAEETLAYSRAQILQQTGLAMLTQANQAPNQLMALFRG